MKKVIILIILPIFLFLGCTTDNIEPSNKVTDNKNVNVQQNNIKNQKYSFGPMADLSKIDDQTKKELQVFLNKLGDVPKDKVTFNIMKAEFHEDGSLVIDLFVRNGHPYTIFDIDAKLEVIQEGKTVASANFNFVKEEFGELPANTSRPWSILYFPEDIKDKNINLDKITLKGVDYQYEY